MGTRYAVFIRSKKYMPRIIKNIIKKTKNENNIKKEAIDSSIENNNNASNCVAELAKKEEIKERKKLKNIIFAHYGQMDGYPDGAGRVIADFLRDIHAPEARGQLNSEEKAAKQNEQRFIDNLANIAQYDDREQSPVDDLGRDIEQDDRSGSGYLKRGRLYPEQDRRGAYLLSTILHGKRWFTHATDPQYGCYVENTRRHWNEENRVKKEEGIKKEEEEEVKKEENPDSHNNNNRVKMMHRACGPVENMDVEWTYHLDLDKRTVLIVWHCGLITNHVKMSRLFSFGEFITAPMIAIQQAFILAGSVINADGALATKGTKPQEMNHRMSDELLSFCVASVIHDHGCDIIPNYALMETTYSQADANAALASILKMPYRA